MSSIAALLKSAPVDDTSNPKKVFKHTTIEFCATTIFVYFGCLSAISTGTKLGGGSGSGEDVGRIFPIAFTFGIGIMCLAFSIGHITGGHMNPGVSLLMFFQRQLSFKKMICYWLAQFTGALLASALVWGSVSNLAGEPKGDGTFAKPPFLLGSTTLDSAISVPNGFLLELMGSFFFYFVISQTALDKNGISKTSFPAIPIGFSLIVVHICLIPFTGCGVNPARSFGPAVMTCMGGEADLCYAAIGSWWWIYFVAPFCASFLVAEISFLINWDTDEEYIKTDEDLALKETKDDDIL